MVCQSVGGHHLRYLRRAGLGVRGLFPPMNTAGWIVGLAVAIAFGAYDELTFAKRQIAAVRRHYEAKHRELAAVQWRIKRDAKLRAVWKAILTLIGSRARTNKVIAADDSRWQDIARQSVPGRPDVTIQRRVD